MKEKLKLILETNQWKYTVVFFVTLCAIVLGLEHGKYFKLTENEVDIFDYIFLIFFLFEIIVRLLAENKILDFFLTKSNNKYKLTSHNLWNIFDLFLVIGSGIAILKHYNIHGDLIFFGRILRVSRIFRLFEISERLKKLEIQILSVLPTLTIFIFLLSILIYSYAIVGLFLFEGNEHFKTTEQALLTVFRIVTLDGWGDIVEDLNRVKSTFGTIFCISFIVQVVIIFLNIFIAVLVKNVENNLDDIENKDLLVKINNLETEIIELKSSIKTSEENIINFINKKK